MFAPTRGYYTSETQVEIEWLAIEALSQETGGSPIDSYNLQWRVTGSSDAFTDLVGQDGAYQTLLAHT
jgi:hypothetical protein